MSSSSAALGRADRHIFCAGMNDLGDALCRANMRFGLAKIHWVQEQLGLPADAIFVGAPDATVTRNPKRWQQGFGYGGAVLFDPRIAVLDSKPNCCGMLVGGLSDAPREVDVRRKAETARRTPHVLEGVSLQYDLHESNHFIDALSLETLLDERIDVPPHLFILHSSGHEHRAKSPWGPGLYVDESQELREQAEQHQTPWGDLFVLSGADADHYHRFCQRVASFNLRRRAYYGELLFGQYDPVANLTHQGYRAPGQHYLGAYWRDSQQPQALFPLTLGPKEPAYLVRALPNFTPEAMKALGWTDRARELGVSTRLAAADILPHGGGYQFAGTLKEVQDLGSTRRFAVEREGTVQSFEDIRDLPFAFRGQRVLQRAMELGLLEPVARYRIDFVVK